MAWGGQRADHGVMLFNRFSDIEDIVQKLRLGKLNHLSAYEAFDEVWKDSKPLGMGAAFFTKIIFFCDPKHNGYIMDQWTAKSANLLSGEPVVHLYQSSVNKKNTYENYEKFCSFVEEISARLGVSAEMVELAMFSKGWGEGPWREYVKSNY